MCAGTPPPRQQNLNLNPGQIWNTQMAKAMSARMNIDLITNRAGDLVQGTLPEVCRKYVYEFKHTVNRSTEALADYVYAKWTFFNDQSISLKAEIVIDEDGGVADCKLPDDFDMEEWEAHAIMVCDAGEEIWKRPKIPTSAQLAGLAQANQAQSQASQRMQSARGAASSGFGGGMLQGLAQGIFGNGKVR